MQRPPAATLPASQLEPVRGGEVRRAASDGLLLSPPLSVPSSPACSSADGTKESMPLLVLPVAHPGDTSSPSKRLSATGADGVCSSSVARRTCDESSAHAAGALPGVLLALVATRCIEPLNEPSVAPVVERRTSGVDWDFFLMLEGSGGEDGEKAQDERNPTVHRKKLLEQLQTLRLVCRAWRDAIVGSDLVVTLYLNRCGFESKCWWPPAAMGHVSKASQFIKTAPLPDDFALRFAGLRRLTLANLRMRFVPEQLRGLAHLEQLNLSGNTLECLPQWFGTLPLLELQLGDPWTGGWADGSPSRHMLCSLGEWLTNAGECALPHTLRHLSLADIKALDRLPKAVRRMEALESLDIHCTTCSIKDDDYLTQLPLKELVLLCVALMLSVAPRAAGSIDPRCFLCRGLTALLLRSAVAATPRPPRPTCPIGLLV